MRVKYSYEVHLQCIPTLPCVLQGSWLVKRFGLWRSAGAIKEVC